MARWVLNIDNADEIAEWNRALTELFRRLVRREVEATRDGKPVNGKTCNMVADIDRYLTKHGYITTKQLNALVDIAKQNQVDLPQTPPK